MPDWLRVVFEVVIAGAVVLYCVGILANLVIGNLQMLRPSTFSSRYPKVDLWVMTSVAGGFMARLKSILLGLQAAVAWPAAINVGTHVVGRKTNVQFSSWLSLELVDRRYALFDATLIAAVVALALGDLIWDPLVIAIAVIVLVGTVCRHVAYLMVGIGDRLRKSRWSPYKALALVAASDAVALLLAVSVLLTEQAGGEINISRLEEAAKDLYGFANLGSLPHESALNVLVALCGLLFYSAVVKTFLSSSTYSRTDDDYAGVAMNFVCTGEPEAAPAWLAKQQNLTSDRFAVQAAVKLTADDFDGALTDAVTAQKMSGGGESDDDALMLLWHILALRLSPDEEQTLAFFERCLDRDGSDVLLCMMMINAVMTQLVSLERLSNSLLDRFTEPSYPLTRAMVFAFLGSPDVGREILAHASPGSEVEEFLRLLYMAEMKLIEDSLERDIQVDLERWRTHDLPVLEELAREIPRSWTKSAAATALAAFVSGLPEPPEALTEAAMDLVRRTSADVLSGAQLERWLVFQREMLISE